MPLPSLSSTLPLCSALSKLKRNLRHNDVLMLKKLTHVHGNLVAQCQYSRSPNFGLVQTQVRSWLCYLWSQASESASLHSAFSHGQRGDGIQSIGAVARLLSVMRQEEARAWGWAQGSAPLVAAWLKLRDNEGHGGFRGTHTHPGARGVLWKQYWSNLTDSRV